jgi:hypothetical protein
MILTINIYSYYFLQAGKTSTVTTMAGMAPHVSAGVAAAAGLPPHLRASFGAAAAPTPGLPAGLTVGQAQAAYAAALDPYLGQSIGPIAGYQNALYRRFAPY